MAPTRRKSARKASSTKGATQHRTSSRVTKKKAAPKRAAPRKKTRHGDDDDDNEEDSKPQASVRLTRATNTSSPAFIVHSTSTKALFTLAAYRGEGMCLLAMNWKSDTPPNDFVGFAIEYQEPGGTQFYAVPNMLSFPVATAHSGPNAKSSRLSPIQKFRWVHFPPANSDAPGDFTYRVTPVFMDITDSSLNYGDFQEVAIQLAAETYPGELNVCFTRGFISSQAFVNKFGTDGGVGSILPASANGGLDFKPEDPAREETALAWMGFEARQLILGALDAAVKDTSAQVRVAAYDFNDPEIVARLEQLGDRLKIIIDDSGSHKSDTSAESKAAAMLEKSAGTDNVQRQHMGGLQHNKSLVVDSETLKLAIGGSTNFSWRGLYVQNNNAVALQGETAVRLFTEDFDNMWANPNNATGFHSTASASWADLGYSDVSAQVTFSPHSTSNSALKGIASDIEATESSLLYSLAFLYETKGVIRDAIDDVTGREDPNSVFVYGISDKTVGGLDLQRPNGNPPVAFPEALLAGHVPAPFEAEATGGSGTRLHHKFVVIDFDKPDKACVYTGSYNFSVAADTKNGENLLRIRDQRVAVSYMVEALAMFDHYAFRDATEGDKGQEQKTVELRRPPAQGSDEKPWWDEYWTVAEKKRDRELFGV